MKSLYVSIDGASQGNPGPAGIGVVLSDGNEAREVSEYLGHATNNVAEYRALLRALEEARSERAEVLTIRSDSQLLVRQIEGRYKVRDPELKALYDRARRLMGVFKQVRLVHAARAENKRADKLARAAISCKRRGMS